jgi:hypothetical protein
MQKNIEIELSMMRYYFCMAKPGGRSYSKYYYRPDQPSKEGDMNRRDKEIQEKCW